MPPIKGRMMGLQASRMGGCSAQLSQQEQEVRSIKNLGISRKKSKFCGNNNNGKATTVKSLKDEQLKKLRIPTAICKTLPSVKKFSNSRSFVDITGGDDDSQDGSLGSGVILGLKKGRGAMNKYHIQASVEKRFNGMVWDLAFSSPNTDSGETELLVSCGDGVFICDCELNRKKELSRIRLAGGVAYLSDGRIVAMCRFMDVINVYSPTGEFINDFPCGTSPMTLAVNALNEILVCDCSAKEIHFYQSDGTLLRKIASRGKDYKLVWPLYMSVMKSGEFIVVDCHQQVVLVFSEKGQYVRTIPMRTFGGSEVLRPHGLCLSPQNDLFIIDNAINTIEVFTVTGTFMQTLLPTDEGTKIKPKIMACSKNGHMAIGSLKGHVRLFKFVDAADARLELAQSDLKVEAMETDSKVKLKIRKVNRISSEVMSESRLKVKQEIKCEPSDVIVLD